MHETWIPGRSWLHRCEPRCKLCGTALLCLLPTALNSLAPLLVLAVAALGSLFLFRLPIRPLLKYLSGIHVFLIPCFLILPFSTPGEPLFRVWGFTASLEGLKFAAILYLRAVTIASAALGLVLTTPIDVLIQAAEKLHVPRVLSQIGLLTYRFLFSFRTDLDRTRIALQTRGFRKASGIHTYRTLAHSTGSLLIRALDRTERVTQAMRCRGYRGSMPTLRTFPTQTGDLIGVVAYTGLCVLFLIWEYAV